MGQGFEDGLQWVWKHKITGKLVRSVYCWTEQSSGLAPRPVHTSEMLSSSNQSYTSLLISLISFLHLLYWLVHTCLKCWVAQIIALTRFFAALSLLLDHLWVKCEWGKESRQNLRNKYTHKELGFNITMLKEQLCMKQSSIQAFMMLVTYLHFFSLLICVRVPS